MHLRLALLLCSCCGGQRGALVDALLDVIEHHEHVVDPGGVARQLSDLTQHNTMWSKFVQYPELGSSLSRYDTENLILQMALWLYFHNMWKYIAKSWPVTLWLQRYIRLWDTSVSAQLDDFKQNCGILGSHVTMQRGNK